MCAPSQVYSFYSCTLRRAPLCFHILCIDITHSPFYIQPLEAQNYYFHKQIDSTSSLHIVLATLLLYLVVCTRICHLYGSGHSTISSPVPSSILEFQEASISWSLDVLRS